MEIIEEKIEKLTKLHDNSISFSVSLSFNNENRLTMSHQLC